MVVSRPYIDELLALPLLTDDMPDKRIKTLYMLSDHAEDYYHSITLAKRNGGKRKLLVPDPLLKQVQRQILHNILSERTISPYAAAYHTGASVRKNAEIHLHQSMILKLDIKNFFPSILFPDILASCFSSEYYSVQIGTLLTNLCCYRGALPQGGPASPAISNLVMKNFDLWVGTWCAEQGIRYTRYCDDLTFSGEFHAEFVKRRVENYLKSLGFELNHNKTQLLYPYNRQQVTGVVVNEKLQTARSYRRELRQVIYYCRTYGVQSHLAHGDKRPIMEVTVEEQKRYLQSLLGKVHYVLQINPQDEEFQQYRAELNEWLRDMQI